MDFLASPRKHADAALLVEYLRAKASGSALEDIGHIVLHEDGAAVLALSPEDDGALRWLTRHGRIKPLGSAQTQLELDFKQLQERAAVRTPADLDVLLGRALLQVARIDGDARNPTDVAKARKELQRQVPIATELSALTREPRRHPQLAMALDMAVAMQEKPSSVLPDFFFAHHPNGLALLATVDFWAKDYQVALVDTLTGKQVGQLVDPEHTAHTFPATWEDLQRVNIHSRTDFDAAVEKALLETFPLNKLPIRK
jgi:hypothetical protein